VCAPRESLAPHRIRIAMFDLVKKSRIIVGIILALIAIPFAFFGIDYYFRGDAAAGQLASVGGTPIGQREFAQALQQRQDQIRRMMQGRVDQAMLNSPELRQQVLDDLVEDRVLYMAALKAGMTVTPTELQTVISEIPAFREDRGAGKFSRQLYEAALRAQGMSEAGFEAMLRRDMMLGRLRQSIAATGFLPDSVLEQLYRLQKEQREVTQLVLAPAQYAGKAKLDEGAAQAYYDAHKEEFKLPEKARLEFVLLSLEAIQRQIQVTEDELEQAYQEQSDKLSTPEERKASHILISVPAGASEETKAKAREKAQALLDQARAAPKQFAELARKNSEDPGSAAEGGDLGFFPRGRMVKPFDDAVSGMKPGEIAGPVETQYGFHVIRLDAIKAAEGPSYDKLKPKLEEDLRKAKAGKRFAEASEVFSSTVHDEPDSLQAAIDALGREPFKLKLEAQTTGWFTAAGGDHPLLNGEKFLRAVFIEDVLKKRYNSEAVEIAPNVLASARVIEYQASQDRPFAEVKAEIVEKLTRDKAAELAKQDGEARLAKLRKGEPVEVAWSTPTLVSRESRQGLTPEAAQAVFRTDASKLPALTGVAVADGRYVLYRVTRVVTPATVDAEAKKALRKQLDQAQGGEEARIRLEALKRKAKIQINAKALEQGG
jgi:peptidyl-prolyl cis-trans isomerase D